MADGSMRPLVLKQGPWPDIKGRSKIWSSWLCGGLERPSAPEQNDMLGGRFEGYTMRPGLCMLVETIDFLHKLPTEYAHCNGSVCDSFLGREPS